MKSRIAPLAVVLGIALAASAQAQQSLLAQSTWGRSQAASSAASRRPTGVTGPAFGSMMYGGRTLNSMAPYNPAGSEYRAPTGHPAAFFSYGSYYGASSSIGIYYPAPGQGQRRR